MSPSFIPRLAPALFLVALFVLAPQATVRAQSSTSPSLVVSQIYTNGGEAGAAHPNDFIEIFNRGAHTIDLRNYVIHVSSDNNGDDSRVIIGFATSQVALPFQPGQYLTLSLSGSSPQQPPLLGPTGTIAVLRSRELRLQFGCALAQDPDLEDFVGYGGAACFEGTGPAPASTPAAAVFRAGNGCADTNDNAADFSLAGTPNPRDGATPRQPCGVPPGASTMQFSVSFITTQENVSSIPVTVTRAGGDTSQPASVDYATLDGTATERRDYTTAIGTLRFAAGETSKTFNVLINDDVLAEGAEVFDISLSNPTGGAVLVEPATLRVTIANNDATNGTANPIDDATFFVRTHYADFLGREPDQAGLDFWVRNFTECNGDAQCVQVKRVNVSAAFFLSIEFQETGYYAYRLYKASFPFASLRQRGFPSYREFIRDAAVASRDVVVGVGNWQQQLDANKTALAEQFVKRGEFVMLYPTTQTPAQFVDSLNANAGNPLSQGERDALVAALTNGTTTRGRVLRAVADDEDFRQAELNRAFVLMQYFGYLRRSPNAAPDTNFDGYDFWLTKLNQFNGNFVDAEMVRAFIESIEYRQRFGQ